MIISEIKVNYDRIEEENGILVTVFTPFYNRIETISRPLNSVRAQSFRNFEYILVDDGSTDGAEHIVEQYMREVDYPITFIRKDNGGKHTAYNLAVSLAKGEYFLCLDSDDELMPNGVELLFNLYKQIPADKRDGYWCAQGRYMDSVNKRMLGLPYPENINGLSPKDRREALRKVRGDKIGLQNTKLLSRYPFPTFEGVTFITERIVWDRLNSDYLQYYSNHIAGVVYDEDRPRLSRPDKSSPQTIKNNYYMYAFWKDHIREYHYGIGRKLIIYVRFFMYQNLADADFRIAVKKTVKAGSNVFHNAFFGLMGFLLSLLYRRKYPIKPKAPEKTRK